MQAFFFWSFSSLSFFLWILKICIKLHISRIWLQEKDGEYTVLCKLIATGGSMEACPALAYDLTRMLTESYHCLEVMAAWSHTSWGPWKNFQKNLWIAFQVALSRPRYPRHRETLWRKTSMLLHVSPLCHPAQHACDKLGEMSDLQGTQS